MSAIYRGIKRMIPNPVKDKMKAGYRKSKALYKRMKTRPYRSSKKVIYFDITTYAIVENHTGIQRVVEQFMRNLPEVSGNDYEVVCLNGVDGYHIIDPVTFAPDMKHYVSPKKGDLFLAIDLNHDIQNAQQEVLKKWQQAGCKLVFCVFDLVFALYPQFVGSKEMVEHLDRWLTMVCSNADGIICISDSVRKELQVWMKNRGIVNDHLNLGYYHLGGDFTDKDAADSKNADIMATLPERTTAHQGTTYIMVSTVEPRKGYKDAIAAFEQARSQQEDITLIIVGKKGWKCEDIEEMLTNSPYYNESMFWMSNCDDATLSVLYGLSDAYITTSYYEGFGLGIIEAAHMNLPVIARDIPIHREVTAEKALFFGTPQELAGQMVLYAQNGRSSAPNPAEIPCLSWKESVEMAWKECLATLKR